MDLHKSQQNSLPITLRQGLLALSPAIVFLLLYVGVSLVISDFYVMPVSVALLIASVWGAALVRGATVSKRVEIFSRAAAHPDILYMIWIFVLAGAFASLAKGIGAIDATVSATFAIFPSTLLLPACFFASCVVSFAIGTSVGAIVALTPLVVELAGAADASVPLFVGAAMGGAFFGDNLSFISDTTIAATRTQGCRMTDKFRANLLIVLPAALAVLGIYSFMGAHISVEVPANLSDWTLMLPYLLVIATAIAGVNVILVLVGGIICAVAVAMVHGFDALATCRMMGEGIDSMGQLIIITFLAAGMLGIVKEMGGITFLLQRLTRRVSGARGAQGCMAVLVSVVNLCTANNTVAILTVGELCRDISRRFHVSPAKTSSVLDTCSCIVQCLIPYGAQTLLATGLAGISPGAPWLYLYYPWALAGMVILSIITNRPRMRAEKISITV